MTYDFLIVGGGIGGAVLANLLGRQGRRVVVLERDPAPIHRVRPEILWPATATTLRAILPAEREADWGLPIRRFRALAESSPLLDLDAEVCRQAGIVALSTDPDRSRELLLAQAPAEVRRGVEVLALLRDGERVSGVRCRHIATGREEELCATWTVGDDGGRSVVREQCGIGLDAHPFALKLCAFGFHWPADAPPATVSVFLNPRLRETGIVAVGLIPLPRDEGIGLIPARPWALDHRVQFDESLAAFAATQPAVAAALAARTSKEIKPVYPHWGHAEKYGLPGAVLIGDAAHPVTPAGGQGANMSVADAVALAELVQECDADLVERYERRRRPANSRSVSISRRAAHGLSLPDWAVERLVPWTVRCLSRNPRRTARALRRIATSFEDRS